MFLKLFLLSISVIALIMLAMGIKLLFNKKAEFTYHSCSTGTDDRDKNFGCQTCLSSDLSHWTEEETAEQ